MNVRVELLVRARPGEARCGDLAIVRQEGGLALFGVVDALGHGDEAAQAAEQARAHLERVSLDLGVAALLAGLDEALRSGRGAAATLCLFDGAQLSCLAVGNVELRSRSSKVGVGIANGIVGRGFQAPVPYVSPIAPGERVVVFSDGLSPYLRVEETRALGAAEACRSLMETYARASDDAAVLVADFEGG